MKLLVLVILTLLILPIYASAEEIKSASFSEISFVVPNIKVEKTFRLMPGSLQKTVFIHYANNRKDVIKNQPCYKLLGSKWEKLPITYVVHPDLENIDPNAIYSAAETWDSATSKELFDNSVIFDSNANWDSEAPDGRNELSLGNYPQENVIAVTVIWTGIPIGSKKRQIIEFDILFDTDFRWGDAEIDGSSVMDLQNIATHELGHGLGLADVYTSSCSEVTMYGYSSYGEIKKRTLEKPDITGLQRLYGI
ncbi:MAG: matrixin family metalloprotease [Candidatus Pacearchaeota archaeon]